MKLDHMIGLFVNTDEFELLKVFNNSGEEFSGIRQAEAYCKSRGWSYGPMQKDAPTAIFNDKSIVSKWRGLSAEDKEQMHGFFFSRDYRYGNVGLFVRKGK